VVTLFVAIASPFLLVGVLAVLTPLPSELLAPAEPSVRVLSRTGSLLREVRASDGARARPLRLFDLPQHARDAVLAAEDRRFYAHHGVDVLACFRALATNLVHARIVSGASTLTMQLARTLRPHPRSLAGKAREAALAVRIEASLSKDRILEEYLNRVSFGPNLRGVGAASLAYFGVAPGSLSVAQAALLAGLPRGPALYEVTRHQATAKRRRDRVLTRMSSAGMIDEAARDRAIAEPLTPNLDKPAFGAPHFVQGLVTGKLPDAQPGAREALVAPISEITSTLDPELQRSSEVAVRAILSELSAKHVTAAAVVALDNETGDVLAYVGSPDFFDEASLGQNDGVLALRQPGSSLKPFVYAEAMAALGYTGATLLPDMEIHIPLPGGGEYTPHDYDTRFRGPTRLREALGNSLNVPAVYTLYQLGTAPALARLHAFGFDSLTEDAEHYGPALALGDGEVSLLELANAYATLARGGLRRPVRLVSHVSRGDGPSGALDLRPGLEVRVVAEPVAAMLTDILSDKTARMAAFGDQNVLEFEFDVAVKTGTSKGYRDNIAVGYTRAVTVAVWAGNFDGSPMAGVSGITGAGPIFHAVMEAAMAHRPRVTLSLAHAAARLGLARTAVCALSGEPPTSACPHTVFEWLPEEDASHAPRCAVHVDVRLDARNGLRAGPACPERVTKVRTFERWDGVYEAWAASMGRAAAPAESSPECPVEPELSSTAIGAPPHIAYPFDGASFLVDPERGSDLQKLEVRVAPFDGPVNVRIDDRPLGPDLRWALVPGEHTIVAASGGRAGSPVRIKVR
jgi:penicillin-binding protein 1C